MKLEMFAKWCNTSRILHFKNSMRKVAVLKVDKLHTAAICVRIEIFTSQGI